MAELPAPIRAALGLAASVIDAARDGRSLPDGFADKALELPVVAVTAALQLSIRFQQQYAALTVRGDEVLTQLRGGAPDEPPEWARFDDEPDAQPAQQPTPEPTPTENAPSRPATATKAPATKAATTKAATKKAPATKTRPRRHGREDPATKTPATKTTATKQAATKVRAKKQAANAIPAPRTGRPSAFDLVGGDD